MHYIRSLSPNAHCWYVCHVYVNRYGEEDFRAVQPFQKALLVVTDFYAVTGNNEVGVVYCGLIVWSDAHRAVSSLARECI